MDVFAEIRKGIESVRAGNRLAALTHFFRAANLIIEGMTGAAPQGAQSSASGGSQDVPEVPDQPLEESLDHLEKECAQAEQSPPSAAQAFGVGGGAFARFLPLILAVLKKLLEQQG